MKNRKIYRNFMVQSIVNFDHCSFASFWQAANENPCFTAEVSNGLAFAIMKLFLSTDAKKVESVIHDKLCSQLLT